ncbi:MAG: hypothetical protein BJBARM4_0817 [Candidatus Parvarchaeum acidiphilum ARMAN-4]|jgi:hypothetical protein|uniref:Uncharacterized protein n=1 Tax=Candidatus Parvarchaeum acidiphilum ARMAN-4 TaxID=662760 RepID=D2EGB7_PARA4|nr:hypothetical protein [Candidatus Parvarchaeum acidiphilum ARMAN-4]EEZ92600.1 MAG: hypothetical protein BJBARM4_0817 [Candidatus Parvarchaeum acidiphilum ARMAN-4]
MEKYEDLEEVLESKRTFNRKVEEAFSSLPKENWMPLKRPANLFPVRIDSQYNHEPLTVINYEVMDSIEQGNLFGRLFKDENEVYLSRGVGYVDGKKGIYFFFLRRNGELYRDIAFADHRTNKVVFDGRELEKISEKHLRKVAYAINEYLSGNYEFL